MRDLQIELRPGECTNPECDYDGLVVHCSAHEGEVPPPDACPTCFTKLVFMAGVEDGIQQGLKLATMLAQFVQPQPESKAEEPAPEHYGAYL